MVAVPVTPPLEMAIVGSPAYFERHGLPETPADLMRHNCLAASPPAARSTAGRSRRRMPGDE